MYYVLKDYNTISISLLFTYNDTPTYPKSILGREAYK